MEAILDIEAIGARGDAVARHEGERVFVDDALPGERHRLHLEPADRQGHRGRSLERLTTSPERVAPPCPHYADCGGCALQHWRAAPYATWKRDRVVEALARIGLEDVPVAALVSVPPASRRRARFTAQQTREGIVVGFHQRRGAWITAISECSVLHPSLARLPGPLAPLLEAFPPPRGKALDVTATHSDTGIDLWIRHERHPPPDGLARLAAFAEAADLARLCWGGRAPEILIERRRPAIRVAGLTLEPPPDAFLQATVASTETMMALTLAGLGEARHVADLFAGIGMLSVALLERGRVTAIDQDRGMLAALEAAGRAGGRSDRLSVRVRDLMRRPLVAAELAAFDAVVLDPPRAGARAQAETLAQAANVVTVVSLSCNPSTFARDARLLVDGGYRMETVTPIDQFLWSAHVEMIAVFRRGPPDGMRAAS